MAPVCELVGVRAHMLGREPARRVSEAGAACGAAMTLCSNSTATTIDADAFQALSTQSRRREGWEALALGSSATDA